MVSIFFFLWFCVDGLRPYPDDNYPRRSHKEVRSIMSGNMYEIIPPPSNTGPIVYPLAITDVAIYNRDSCSVPIRITTIQNPSLVPSSFSVFEPGGTGGCSKVSDNRVKTTETARKFNCVAAANGGFFSTSTGECLGNIISDGRVVQNTEVQNVNFGIRQDGSYVIGYLSAEEVANTDNPFKNLIAGVVWLVRNGQNYVAESAGIEDMRTQETGDQFVSVISARTALGHLEDGRLVLVQVEGKTNIRGLNLDDFANFLKQIGVVNAINLDGGGSATTVLNGTLVSVPSDICPWDEKYSCERKVTTIICVHEPYCTIDCNNHGRCLGDRCICDLPWEGPHCNLLIVQTCPSNCSNNGICSNGDCICSDPWKGPLCDLQYPKELTHTPFDEDYLLISKKVIGFTVMGVAITIVLVVAIYAAITQRFNRRVDNWIEEDKIQDSGTDNLVELEKIGEISKDSDSATDDEPSSN